MASNTKLKTGDYIDLSDVTKDQLDACVAVAEAQGLIPTQLVVNEGLKARDINSINKYFGVFEDGKYIGFSDTGDSDLITALTLEQWLFSNAPDWAVDIRYSGDCYFYSDGRLHTNKIGSKIKSELCSDESMCQFDLILSRTPQEEWMPKVGDDCMVRLEYSEPLKAKIEYLGVNFVCYKLYDLDDESIISERECCAQLSKIRFTPLPPSLEDELFEYFEEVSNSARYVVGGNRLIAQELIEKGWKK